MGINFKRVTLLSILLLTFISCGKSDVDDKGHKADSSTFEIDSIRHESFNTFSTNEAWPEVKDTAEIFLMACLVDRVFFERVIGESFTVQTSTGTQKVKSNTRGCITWKENIAFDFTADETFIEVTGTIENDSRYVGAVAYNVAVNPWKEQILNLKDGGKPQKMVTHGSELKNTTNEQLSFRNYSLFVDDFSFKSNLAQLKLRLQTTPLLIRKDIDGTSIESNPLSGGEFDIKMDVFQRLEGSGKRLKLGGTRSYGSIDNDGRVLADLNLELSKEIYRRSKLELIFTFTPIDQDKIKSFQGMVFLENLDGSKGGEITRLKDDLEEMRINAEENERLQVKSDVRDDFTHGFIIDSVRPLSSALPVGNNNDKLSTTEDVKMFIGLDIVDTIVFQGVNSEFKVELIDNTTDEIVYSDISDTKLRDRSGLLSFDPKLSYDQLEDFEYKEYIIRVTGMQDQFQGISAERKVCLNPRKTGNNFLIDCNDFSLPKITDKSAPQVYYNQFSFEFNRNETEEYAINKNLDLLGKRVLNLEVLPKIKSTHNFNSEAGAGYPIIKRGLFEVTFLLLYPNSDLSISYDQEIDLSKFAIITGDKKEAFVEDGMLKVEVSLPFLFQERVFMGYKCIAALMIKPVDEESKLRPGFLIGDISIFSQQGIVRPYRSNMVTSENDQNLIEENYNFIAKAQRKLKDLDKKLKKDHELSDSLALFKKAIKENNNIEKVPVWDFENYEEKYEQANFEIFDTPQEFVEKSKSVSTSGGFFNNEKDPLTLDEVKKLVHAHNIISLEEAQKVCRLFFDPKERSFSIDEKLPHFGFLYRQCLRNPGEFIEVQQLKFVDKITKQPREVYDPTGQPTLTEGFLIKHRSDAYFATQGQMFTEVFGSRRSEATVFGAHSAFDFARKILKSPMGIFNSAVVEQGIRYDKFDMSTQSQLVSQQRRAITQDAVNFGVTTVNAKFEADFRRCALITPKYFEINHFPQQSWKDYYNELDQIYQSEGLLSSNLIGRLADISITEAPRAQEKRSVTSPHRFLVCDNKNINQILKENWFYVRIFPGTNMGDIDQSLAINAVASTFRGKNIYNEFRTKDLEHDKRIIIDEMRENNAVKRFLKFMEHKSKNEEIDYRDRLGVGFPGLIE